MTRSTEESTRATEEASLWTWEPDTGVLETTFATQADAEAWLSESYEDLADDGVTEVTLREGDRVVYGPMSLLPG